MQLTAAIPPQESKRIIQILSEPNPHAFAGNGCQITSSRILTTRRVVERALKSGNPKEEPETLFVGDATERDFNPVRARVIRWGNANSPQSDLALLEILEPTTRARSKPAVFVAPLSYERTIFAAKGFSPSLRTDVQVEGEIVGGVEDGMVKITLEEISGEFAFEGAPVWSPELNAFVGLVSGTDRSVCISSSALCRFCPELDVKFRIPSSQVPEIDNFEVDDPNVGFFGTRSEADGRRLTATLKREKGRYVVNATYEILPGSPPARGRYVTFLTYPDFGKDYQLSAEIEQDGKAREEFYPGDPDFTIAAVGDGGDTRLTLNLEPLLKELEAGSKKRETNDAAVSAAVPSGHTSVSPANTPEIPAVVPIAVPAGHTYLPPGYNCEFTGVGVHNGKFNDQLKVGDYAKRLGEQIASRDTVLPLAVGLFGNWGSGKSHFMNLIDVHLKVVAKEGPEDWARRAVEAGGVWKPDPNGEGPWCQQIVPVYFNAWHYMDSNLWASLVTHVFDRLFAHLKPKPDDLKKVHDLLEQASGATARATEELVVAKAETAKAQTELDKAEQALTEAVANKKTLVLGLRDGLVDLLPDLSVKEIQTKTAVVMGMERELNTIRDLDAAFTQAKTTAGRTQTLWNSVWRGRGWKWRLGWLLPIVAASYFGTSWLVDSAWFKDGRDWMAWLIGLVAPLLPLVGVALTQANKVLGTMESWLAKARAAQQRREKEDPKIQEAEKTAQSAKAREQAASNKLAEAKDKQRQLQEEIKHLTPERRISRFIEQRAQSSDYRGQLGIVSLARRDFEELSNLFTNKQKLKDRLKELNDKNEASKDGKDQPAADTVEAEATRIYASIDRIVLFVDDLDRCQPDKVVEVLQAVHLLLAFPLFAVVVSVDQRCLKQSLRMQFRGLLTQDITNGNGADKATIDFDERPATPLDYLEKIFHIPFHLPPMEKEGFEALIANLTEPKKEAVSAPNNKQEGQSTGNSTSRSTSEPETGGSKTAEATKPPTPQTAPETITIEKTPQLAEPSGDHAKEATPVQPEKRADSADKNRVGSAPLHDWERNALKEHYALIATPRGATRLLNTYRLIRAGVPKDEWDSFCGDHKGTGEFRVAMLLLAVSAGRPSVARNWFARIRKMRSAKPGELANPSESEVGPLHEWEDFVKNFDQTASQLKPECLEKWLRRVERFTF